MRRLRFRFLLGLSVFVSAVIAGSPVWAACQAPANGQHQDPFKLYGDSLAFDVIRDDSPVGFHRVQFKKRGNELFVKSKFQIEISFLFFTAYRYIYESESVWRNGCLISLKASTNDDGTVSSVTAKLENGQILIEGPAGKRQAKPGIYPTNHWNAGVLKSNLILNTITGDLNRIKIVDKGKMPVTVNGQTRQAGYFVYKGELNNELWYDDFGRWVKMRFRAKDDSVIEYICQRCRKD